MAFAEEDDPVKIRPESIDELVDARLLQSALFGAQRGIDDEDDAFGERDVASLREARDRISRAVRL